MEKVPKLRFKEFSGEWEEKKLGDIGKVSMCKRIMKDQTSLVGDIPFYKIGTFGKKPDAYISKEIYIEYRNKYSFPKKGDILLSASGTIGRTVIYNGEPSYFQDSNIVWIANNEKIILNSFLFQLYKNIRWTTEDTTIARLYNDNLSSMCVFISTLEEQQKISDFLSSVDKKISIVDEKLNLFKEYKKGMMQKIFSQKIRFKDSNGNDYPEWEEKRLGDFIVEYNEKTTKNNQYPVLTSSRKGIFLQKDYFAGQDVASEDTTGYNIVPRGYFTYRHMSDDLIFKFNINNIVDNGIVSTLYPVFTTKNINDIFLKEKLNNGNEFKKYSLFQKQGGSRTYMYLSKLLKLKLFLPCLEEQEKIADFLSSIDNKIENLASELENLKEFKKGLLQQMFV